MTNSHANGFTAGLTELLCLLIAIVPPEDLCRAALEHRNRPLSVPYQIKSSSARRLVDRIRNYAVEGTTAVEVVGCGSPGMVRERRQVGSDLQD